jgi:hypothetical protein
MAPGFRGARRLPRRPETSEAPGGFRGGRGASEATAKPPETSRDAIGAERKAKELHASALREPLGSLSWRFASLRTASEAGWIEPEAPRTTIGSPGEGPRRAFAASGVARSGGSVLRVALVLLAFAGSAP